MALLVRLTTGCKFILPLKLFFIAVTNPVVSLISTGFNPTLLPSIHLIPATVLESDEPFPPTNRPYACMRTSPISKCLILSCSRSKHVLVAKRPSPSKQQKFKHSPDMSVQLKLINSLPLIYWEPEQDAVYTEVTGKHFYYHLLTIKLNALPTHPQKLGQKVCVSMALHASKFQTQSTRWHPE